uniref:Uncharacterized protein n=1 Tax=Oryza brachyantha TaxID=4533 RepID=J3LNX3_ORYBR
MESAGGAARRRRRALLPPRAPLASSSSPPPPRAILGRELALMDAREATKKYNMAMQQLNEAHKATRTEAIACH